MKSNYFYGTPTNDRHGLFLKVDMPADNNYLSVQTENVKKKTLILQFLTPSHVTLEYKSECILISIDRL